MDKYLGNFKMPALKYLLKVSSENITPLSRNSSFCCFVTVFLTVIARTINKTWLLFVQREKGAEQCVFG